MRSGALKDIRGNGSMTRWGLLFCLLAALIIALAGFYGEKQAYAVQLVERFLGAGAAIFSGGKLSEEIMSGVKAFASKGVTGSKGSEVTDGTPPGTN